ncbi:MAG: iron ABC transporter permease [Pseudomonadota bacterium]
MSRDRTLLIGLTFASVIVVLSSCLLGATPIGPWRAIEGLLGLGTPTDVTVLREIRLPRALAAFLAGGSLAISGAALQGLLRNPLAEPGVLGVTAASSFGAILTITFGLAVSIPFALPLSAIISALAATVLITLWAHRVASVVTLILIGVALSSFIGALMSLTLSLSPNPLTTNDLLNWSFGSVANRSWYDLALAAPFMATGSALLLHARHGLTLLTLGEETAATSGLDLRVHRRLVIVGTGLVTGASVSLAGAIGFIGIIAPHIVRRWVGGDPGRSLLPSLLVGGIVLTFADIAIRIMPLQPSLRLGVAASLVGAPLFAFIAARGVRR